MSLGETTVTNARAVMHPEVRPAQPSARGAGRASSPHSRSGGILLQLPAVFLTVALWPAGKFLIHSISFPRTLLCVALSNRSSQGDVPKSCQTSLELTWAKAKGTSVNPIRSTFHVLGLSLKSRPFFHKEIESALNMNGNIL